MLGRNYRALLGRQRRSINIFSDYEKSIINISPFFSMVSQFETMIGEKETPISVT
jgi:hypothetical protein